MGTIRILLADDHNIMRDGLRLLLERQSDFEIVGEASDGRQAIALAQELRPDIAIMDIAMPDMNGMEATRRIVESCPRTGVIILSMHYDESYVIRSLKAGARGYLLKDSVRADLISAIRAVMQAKTYFSPKISQILQEDYMQELEQKEQDDSYDLLTDREREVLQLIAEGLANKEIANKLNLSVYTVDTHRSHILRKLNLHSVPEVILYAVRKNIIA
ncbi:MAG TPA: response regulator transcription factor [Bryobacteraceae bacterium]|nr:response regulator transcription factor [Bryobacteraceae bacterium]